MAITPTGSPAWVRNADHTTYGGDTEKANWKGIGVVNPKTDVGAEAFTRMCSDLAAVVLTAPWAEITLLMDDATPDDPTVEVCNLMTGVRSSSYAGGSPPDGFPTVTRVSDGVAKIAFSAAPEDPYSVAGTLALNHATVSVQSNTAACATYALSDENSDGSNDAVTVYVWTPSTGAAATSKRVTVTVY